MHSWVSPQTWWIGDQVSDPVLHVFTSPGPDAYSSLETAGVVATGIVSRPTLVWMQFHLIRFENVQMLEMEH